MADAAPHNAAPTASSAASQQESPALRSSARRVHPTPRAGGSAHPPPAGRYVNLPPAATPDRPHGGGRHHGRVPVQADESRTNKSPVTVPGATAAGRPGTTARPGDPGTTQPDAARLAVCAADPITQLALISYIRRQPHLMLTGWGAPADIVVAALQDPDAEALAQLREQITDDPLLIVIVDGDWSVDLHTALEAGVRGVLFRRDFTWERFSEALREVRAGHGDLPTALQGRLIDQMRHIQREVLAPRGLTPGGLTTREADVLQLVAEGHELHDIGVKLGYSERTVKNVLYAIIKRHQLRNRAHAVGYAIRHGLI